MADSFSDEELDIFEGFVDGNLLARGKLFKLS